MSKIIVNSGRFCNHLIRNIALSIISEKYDLFVISYNHIDTCEKLGFNFYNGKNNYKRRITVNNNNFIKIMNSNILKNNVFLNDYFQEPEIIKLIIENILNKQKENIICKNKFKDRYNNNNDIFIHIRAGDLIKANLYIESNYYINEIKRHKNYDKIYISSDDINCFIVKEVSNFITENNIKFEIKEYDEVDTILFGSTCKNIILSNGTFSWTIGILGFFSNIAYPDLFNTNRTKWHPNLYSNLPDWKPISLP